jgi:hypothetical protein
MHQPRNAKRVGPDMADPVANTTDDRRDHRHTTRSRRHSAPPSVVATNVFPPEPGRITTTVSVQHRVCGRVHLHLVRRAGDVTSVIRRPHCHGARYRVIIPAASVPAPRTSPETDTPAVRQ